MNPEELLDYGLIADIPRSKALYEQLLRFHWEFYSELAYQRKQVYDLLKSSLRERASAFEFSKWQRAVKYKYSLDPLSTRGSLSDPGGRFNIGAIDTMRYPVFPALYLASDKGTALAELLGRGEGVGSLSAEELALTRPESIAAVSVSGKLEAVLDIRERNNLLGFLNLIKGFRLSKSLISNGKRLGLPPLTLITTVNELTHGLEMPNWRDWTMRFDVPAPCQIFGRIVMDAEIEGILYTSVLTKRPCLVVYPQNFRNSASYVELEDPLPIEIVHKRIDAATLKTFI
jgi:hypothetical protein